MEQKILVHQRSQSYSHTAQLHSCSAPGLRKLANPSGMLRSQSLLQQSHFIHKSICPVVSLFSLCILSVFQAQRKQHALEIAQLGMQSHLGRLEVEEFSSNHILTRQRAAHICTGCDFYNALLAIIPADNTETNLRGNFIQKKRVTEALCFLFCSPSHKVF